MDTLWQRRKVEARTYFENLMNKLEELQTVYQENLEEEPQLNNDCYFNDGVRKIDFIFVYKRFSRRGVKDIVNKYIRNLALEGVQFEVGESELFPELMFIKVHATRKRLLMCSVLLNYEPAFMRIPDAPLHNTIVFNLPFMFTDLMRRELLSEVVQRASASSLGGRPKDLTDAERIMITNEILKHVSFGKEHFDIGLRHLLVHKYLVAAYPLHEHPSYWTKYGDLHDRQLLYKYWAKLTNLFKYQPLDLIHKYYGPEVAFYFAFLGFYNRMLIPAAIFGVIAHAYGAITYDSDKNPFSRDVCNSKEYFCPPCHDARFCDFRAVADDCEHSKTHYILDNTMTITYAIFMCFWATVVSELWKREENILKYKWNLLNVEKDNTPRPEYERHATHKRFNKQTGKYDFYIPGHINKAKLLLSWIGVTLLALIIVLMVIATIILRLIIVYAITTKEDVMAVQKDKISHIISTFILYIFMMLFDLFYKHMAKAMTDFESPRTQTQYDESFILKLHVLSILNAYAYLYYTAFFKGYFRTYPGDEDQYKSIGILNHDVSEAMGTMLPLNFQLIIILTAKMFVKMFYEFIIPIVKICYQRRRVIRELKITDYNPRNWERDYYRRKIGYYTIAVGEFKTIISQYGYLIIFPAAFSLGPMIALLANIVELRIDAYKLTKWSRRPVPTRVPGIGAWNSILSTLSYIGIITNCFYIAFTTNFIFYIRVYYFGEDVNILNSTFSAFDVRDFSEKSTYYGYDKVQTCLYPGSRFPHDHPREYQYNKQFWTTKCSQLMVVIVLEVVVLSFNKLLSFAIPDMPAQIKERIHLRRQRENAAREKRLNEKLQADVNPRTSSLTREQLAARLRQMQPQF